MKASVRQLGLTGFTQNKRIYYRVPDTRPSDVTFLVSGMGRQSGTIQEMICEGVLPKPDAIFYGMVGMFSEPVYTHIYRNYARTRLTAAGVEYVEACAQCGTDLLRDHMDGWGSSWYSWEHTTRKISIPAWLSTPEGKPLKSLLRQCTETLKVTPTNHAMKEWLLRHGYIDLPPGYRYEKSSVYPNHWDMYERHLVVPFSEWPDLRVPRGLTVELWLGFSADEALRGRSLDMLHPNWQKLRYPLTELGMTADDCVGWLRERKLPVPLKSACIMCPYRSDESWLELKTEDPDSFRMAVEYDEFMRATAGKEGTYKFLNNIPYLHKSRRPLKEIDFAAELAARKRAPAGSLFELETIDAPTCAGDGGYACHL